MYDSCGTNVTLQVSAHPASTYQRTVERFHLCPPLMSGKTMLWTRSIDTILTIIVTATTMRTAQSTTMHLTVTTRDILTRRDILTTSEILMTQDIPMTQDILMTRDILTTRNIPTIQDTITSLTLTALALSDTTKTLNKKKRRSLHKFSKNC